MAFDFKMIDVRFEILMLLGTIKTGLLRNKRYGLLRSVQGCGFELKAYMPTVFIMLWRKSWLCFSEGPDFAFMSAIQISARSIWKLY